MSQSDRTSSDDNYVPMNPGSSALLAIKQARDIPISPGPHHLDPFTALPVDEGLSQGSEIQPPPVNRNLKPDRKGEPYSFPHSVWKTLA